MRGKRADKFYSSKAWQDCRNAYRRKVRGLCEKCLELGYITPGDHVHHKRPLTAENIDDPDISLSHDNLILLCAKHHAEIHGRIRTNARYIVDEEGHVTAIH